MASGTIFSIEEFAINDGPGIRTTVFLKGCPLRCAWCHNPEGLSPEPQVFHGADGDRISGAVIEARELADELLRNREFFAMNGGGVTFTGGEPTMQPAFLCEVLDLLEDVHKAVETSGWCAPKVYADVLDRVDLVLQDLKLADPAAHRRWTGRDNAPILANLDTLKRSGKPFVIRIPLIPGVNDGIAEMEAKAALLRDAPGLRRVEMLRYHKTAGAKYPRVDMTYRPGFDTEAQPAVYKGVFGDIETLVL